MYPFNIDPVDEVADYFDEPRDGQNWDDYPEQDASGKELSYLVEFEEEKFLQQQADKLDFEEGLEKSLTSRKSREIKKIRF